MVTVGSRPFLFGTTPLCQPEKAEWAADLWERRGLCVARGTIPVKPPSDTPTGMESEPGALAPLPYSSFPSLYQQ